MDENQTADAVPEITPEPGPAPVLPPFVTATKPATDIRARI
jgi:flagellar motor switch protein FliM